MLFSHKSHFLFIFFLMNFCKITPCQTASQAFNRIKLHIIEMDPAKMKFFATCLTALLLATLAPHTTSAQTNVTITSATTSFSDGLQGDLEKIVASHRGIMGIYCEKLGDGPSEIIAINADEIFPTASTIKVATMCAAMDQLVSGKGPFENYYSSMPYDETTTAGGSGWIQNYKFGTKIELKELIHLMITVSDNVATNMISVWIGLDTINQWLIDHGFEHTRQYATIGSRQIYDKQGREEWGLGSTTPREMARLMKMIVNGEAGTTSSTEEMLRILGHQYFDAGIAGAIPPMVYVGSKGGSVNASRSDVAIVAGPSATYILSIYTKENVNTSWKKNENEAELAITKISGLIWKHFHPDSTWQPAPGSENF